MSVFSMIMYEHEGRSRRCVRRDAMYCMYYSTLCNDLGNFNLYFGSRHGQGRPVIAFNPTLLADRE